MHAGPLLPVAAWRSAPLNLDLHDTTSQTAGAS